MFEFTSAHSLEYRATMDGYFLIKIQLFVTFKTAISPLNFALYPMQAV